MIAFTCQSVDGNVSEDVIFCFCYLACVASISKDNNRTVNSSKTDSLRASLLRDTLAYVQSYQQIHQNDVIYVLLSSLLIILSKFHKFSVLWIIDFEHVFLFWPLNRGLIFFAGVTVNIDSPK